MPPTPQPTLPVIDISPFLPPTPTTPTTLTTAQITCAHALHTACHTTGFFYLTSHSIPPALTSRILSYARAFFQHTPAAQKRAIARRNPDAGGDGARGYQRLGENVTGGRRDLHEGVDWYRPVSVPLAGDEGDEEGKRGKRGPPYEWLMGPNLWPAEETTGLEEIRGFRECYEEYVGRMLELGTAVVWAMGVGLGLQDSEVFVRATARSWWVMRAIGYPPLPPPPPPRPSATSSAAAGEEKEDKDGDGDEGSLSCGAHTDYGCLTLLLADPTPGALQVQSPSEPGTWINADPIPGAFVVNIGDMMERWTNGLYKSTRHRVVHRAENFRVSVPFFFEPDFDALVEPLGECVRACGGARRFGGVRYGEHLLGKVRGNFAG